MRSVLALASAAIAALACRARAGDYDAWADRSIWVCRRCQAIVSADTADLLDLAVGEHGRIVHTGDWSACSAPEFVPAERPGPPQLR